MRSGPTLVLVAALAMIAAPARAGEASDWVVQASGDRLTIRVRNVPLADVLAAIRRETGADVRGEPAPRHVTLDVRDAPTDEALVRLLGRGNVALTYGADGQLRTIELLGTAAAGPAWPPGGLPASPSAAEVSPERQQAVMGRQLAVDGRLAKALGTRRPTAGQLIVAALQHPDAEVRLAAQRRALAAFDTDPEIEDVFSRVLLAVDDATIARIMRGWPGDHGEDFIARLAAQARTPELRAKASAVLDQLRAGGGNAGL